MYKMVGLAVVIMCNIAQAQEVTATGSGGSFLDALQNAKTVATEYVASTFVTGREELDNGKYTETLGQYNGGLIRKYKVTNTVNTRGIYAVTIYADVDTDKINRVIVHDSTSTNEAIPHVEKFVDEFTKTSEEWKAIDRVSNPFALVLDKSTYNVYNGNVVDITYRFHMRWNPKWIDDARQLTKAVGRSPSSGEGTYAVCFERNSHTECGGVLTLPNTQRWGRVAVAATVHFIDGKTETHTLYATPLRQLYSTHDVTVQETGWFKPIVTVHALSMYQQEVSPLDLHMSFSVEKFKTVSSVMFTQCLHHACNISETSVNK